LRALLLAPNVATVNMGMDYLCKSICGVATVNIGMDYLCKSICGVATVNIGMDYLCKLLSAKTSDPDAGSMQINQRNCYRRFRKLTLTYFLFRSEFRQRKYIIRYHKNLPYVILLSTLVSTVSLKYKLVITKKYKKYIAQRI
jgi:hypothetical protein